jgi:hypothetical protein
MSEATLQMPIDGGCLCGAVRFTIGATSKWSAHCHCSLCRRAHGAAFVTWLGYNEDSVAIDNGDDTLRWYESSPGAERGFCVRCGSTIFFRSKRWPGELHITVANLDGDADRVPQAHVFWDSHVDWIDLGADLPRRDGGGA